MSKGQITMHLHLHFFFFFRYLKRQAKNVFEYSVFLPQHFVRAFFCILMDMMLFKEFVDVFKCLHNTIHNINYLHFELKKKFFRNKLLTI